MKSKFRSLALLTAVALVASGTAFAAGGAWMRIITVKTDNVTAYATELEHGRTMMKRLGVNVQLRIWRATFAGPNTGTIVVSQEYPSWAALAESQTKTAADSEFSTWLSNLDKLRTITSDSIYREL